MIRVGQIVRLRYPDGRLQRAVVVGVASTGALTVDCYDPRLN